jgi:hypothetical protein
MTEGLFHDGKNASEGSGILYDDNSEYYVHSIKSSEDDINENTDTEDGGEELIDLIEANARLIAFIAKQRATLERLRHRITRMKRYIKRLTDRMDELTARNYHGRVGQDSVDSASVLMDDETETSLLIKPGIDVNVEMKLFDNAKVKMELEQN